MEKSKKVGLIEDDTSMQSLLKTLLELEGFRVVLIPDRSGLTKILEVILTEKPDILLLDVNLKNVNGFDILQQVQSFPERSAMRIVMSSGMDLRDECLRAGADSFLMKPYMPDELIKKITESV
jgi:DNA-binding response OmpR family regulator